MEKQEINLTYDETCNWAYNTFYKKGNYLSPLYLKILIDPVIDSA